MNQWIDIHCHILPAVDDGPVSLQQTIQMLEIAHAEGIGHFIATPHYKIYDRNIAMEELQSKLILVREEAKKIDENFNIDLGNELFYSEEIIEHLKSKKALTLANTSYVLVEFMEAESFQNIRSGLYKFLLHGYLPILAHLERYECLHRNYDYIKDLIKLGAYMQMNIGSIIENKKNRHVYFYRKLLKMGYIHFLGTDSHSDRFRAPRMREGVTYIAKILGKELVTRLLITNPTKLLLNQPIDW